MKIGKYEIKKFQENKQVGLKELGQSGTTILEGMISDEEYNSDLTGETGIGVYDQMRRSDASVKAALLAVTLPLRSANWFVQSASEDETDKEVADFVDKALKEDMTITFDDFLRQALLYLPFGFMVFEKVYKMDKYEGRDVVTLKKLAPRMPATIYKWETEDEKDGITQQLPDGEHVSIPVEKLLIFVNEKEGDNWEGISLLRAAYKHWFIKETLYKIDAIAHERQGLGIPEITLPENYSAADKAYAKELCENIRANEKAQMIKPQGWETGFMDMKAKSTRDVVPSIKHHNRQIFISVLAQFLDLGGSDKGSYALSKDQSSFFLLAEQSIANQICDVMNNYAIRELVDLNYDVEEYPKLAVDQIAQVDVEKYSKALVELINAGVVGSDDNLEQYTRNVLDLPEKVEEEVTDSTVKEKKDVGKKEEEEQDDVKAKEPKKKVFELAESNFKSWRPLTMAESRLKLNTIENKIDKEQVALAELLEEIYRTQEDALIKDFDRALVLVKAGKRKEAAKLVRSIKVKYRADIARILSDGMKEIYEYGKINAANTMQVASPVTPAEDMQRINLKVDTILDKHESDLLAKAKYALLEGLQNRDSEKQISYEIKQKLDKVLENRGTYVSGAVINDSMNNGRALVHRKNEGDIYAYQFSAILDRRTCNTCMSLDGRIVDVKSPKYEEYKPPIHSNCRCMWVEILKEEVDKPDITDIPKSISSAPIDEFREIKKPIVKKKSAAGEFLNK